MNILLNEKWKKLVMCICLAAGTIAAYEPIRHNGFVDYDDDKYITDNPVITSGITRQSLSEVFKPHYFMWHPLTTFTNMLDCQLFGLNPLGHHLVSLALHIVNSLLLFWILSAMTGSIWACAFVAAVFALHPLQVESVAWASERKTVLSGLFWFLTTAVYIWYTKKTGFGRYIPLFVMYAFCITTKPSVVTFPLVLLLLDYWPLGRLNWGVASNKKTVPVWKLLMEKVPLLVLSSVLSVLTVIAQKGGGTVATLANVSIEYRIFNMFFSYIRYIGKMIWPSGLAAIYPLPDSNYLKSIVAVCILIFVLITLVCIYTGRRRKYLAVGWLWFVGTLVPMIGLVQVGSQAIANRYMYISILGLLIIAAWSVKDMIAKRPGWSSIAKVSAAVVILLSGILTRMQVRHWQNSITLFEYALEVTERNPIAENGFGCALFNDGRLSEAEGHLRRAIQINPKGMVQYKNLSKVLLQQGKPDEAIKYLNGALRIKPDEAEVYANLGVAYSQLGKNEAAIQNWTKAMQLNPDNAEILNNMAWLLVTVGEVSKEDIAKAIEFARRACEITRYKKPSLLDTLAAAYAAAGRFAEATATAEKAMNVAMAAGRKDLAGEIQSRLELYKAGRPYRGK